MDFDNGWKALCRPGQASNHFDIRDAATIEPRVSAYSPINAWWLAELTRLVYRDREYQGITTDEILHRVNLRTLTSIEKGGLRCDIVVPRPAGPDGFAVLVFRGTVGFSNWLLNFKAAPRPWRGKGLVHMGFRQALDAMWPDILPLLASIEDPVFYAGHSLGGALATLAAGLRAPRALYAFASPRVGDADFARSFETVPTYRVVNQSDVVPSVPPSYPSGYCHAGELRYITHDSRVLVNPPGPTTAADRRDRKGTLSGVFRRRWTDAPLALADHAPVNYVAHLERALTSRE